MPTDWGKSAFGLKSLRPNLALGGRILDTALCAGLLVTWPRRLLLLAPVEMLLNLSPEEFGWPLRTAESRSPLCLLLPSLCEPEAWSHTGGTSHPKGHPLCLSGGVQSCLACGGAVGDTRAIAMQELRLDHPALSPLKLNESRKPSPLVICAKRFTAPAQKCFYVCFMHIES